MLIQLIIYSLIQVVGLLTGFLPNSGEVPLKIPYGIDEILLQGIGGYNMLSTYFPPFQVVLTAFLIYFGFRLALMIIRAIPILGKTIQH